MRLYTAEEAVKALRVSSRPCGDTAEKEEAMEKAKKIIQFVIIELMFTALAVGMVIAVASSSPMM